jgi:lysophospholipase L1-like esterase
MARFVSGRLWLILAIVAVVFTAGLELILRKVWGFGDMVLFQSDDQFEYIAQANQDRFRFGNRSLYNEYSMRSEPIRKDEPCIILGFGDSVINGGVLTDHDSLATSIVEDQLSNGSRFLNISAGSWGPDNCAGYLQKFGGFNAKMIVLFVSSHDAHDNMTFERTVGYHESYPNKQYPMALIEVFAKYLIPRLVNKFQGDNISDPLMINKNGIGFNSGFEYFSKYTKEHDIPFLICLHLEKQEVADSQFNSQGEEILSYCKANNIKVITGLEIGENDSYYRDDIHLNEKGQKLWARALLTEIKNTPLSCR